MSSGLTRLEERSIFLPRSGNNDMRDVDERTHIVDAKVLLELRLRKTVRNVGRCDTQLVPDAAGTLANAKYSRVC